MQGQKREVRQVAGAEQLIRGVWKVPPRRGWGRGEKEGGGWVVAEGWEGVRTGMFVVLVCGLGWGLVGVVGVRGLVSGAITGGGWLLL